MTAIFARRCQSSIDNASARSSGLIPACFSRISTSGLLNPNPPDKLLRSFLRLAEKPAFTKRKNFFSSSFETSGCWCVVITTTWLSTFGGGVKNSAGTSWSSVTSPYICALIARMLMFPGSAANRSATSFWIRRTIRRGLFALVINFWIILDVM